MSDKNLGAIRYASLCTQGTNQQTAISHDVARLRRVSFLLMDAEDQNPTNTPRYRAEMATIKESIHHARGELMRHVAHCTDGCARDNRGGMSASAFTNAGAPAHQKPELPPMADIAARLRLGEVLEAIAVEYERNLHTIRQRLNHAGFNARTGKLTTKPEPKVRPVPVVVLLDDQPWRDEALCAQTDPESFFPEKGGSTREAKSVCTSCTVSAECLDYALAHEERFGIWGGMSERERRKVAAVLRTNLDQESA